MVSTTCGAVDDEVYTICCIPVKATNEHFATDNKMATDATNGERSEYRRTTGDIWGRMLALVAVT